MNQGSRIPKAYRIVPSNRYEKDVKRLAKSGADLSKLESVVDALAQNKLLPARNRDHELKGDLKGIRECHIAPDWLLLYKKERHRCILLLLRTGSHRDTLNRE